jgi:type I restriction enzyme, S subunit
MKATLLDGWKESRLSDILDTIENGSRPAGGIQEIDQGIPSIGGEHLDSNGGFKLDNVRLIPKQFYDELRRGKIKKYDVLLVKDGATTGKVSIVDNDFPYEEAAVNEHLFILRGKKDVVDQGFLFYHLLSPWGQKQIATSFHGAAIGGINSQFVKNYSLLLPPLAIQKRIVPILKKVERARELRREASELAKDWLKSYFLETFGDPATNPKRWEVKTMRDVCEVIVDCPHSTPHYSEDTTPYACIRTSELKDGYIDWSSMKYLDETDHKERIRRLSPAEGDIVYGREGTFGEAAIVPKHANISLGQRVMLFRPDYKTCTSEFLWAMIRSSSFYNQALKAANGSTVGHVNVKDILRFRIIQPPLVLQEKFSFIAMAVGSIRERQEATKDNLEKLLAVTMQRAFKGELVC